MGQTTLLRLTTRCTVLLWDTPSPLKVLKLQMLDWVMKFGLWPERVQNFWTRWPCFWWKMDIFISGRVIIITVFPWQFLVKTHNDRYNTENCVGFLQKPQKQHWRCFVKEAVHKKLCQFQRKTPVLESRFLQNTSIGCFCGFSRKTTQFSML